MKAVVYKSTGNWYVTKTADGQTFNARIRGIFKIDGITSTNPIAVGDEVEIELENELEHTATITVIYDRRNYITRQSPAHKMHHHIIASNLDQSLLFATLKDPKTSTGFIDRFLLTCEAYHVPAIIVFNKTDVYRKKEMDKLQELSDLYAAIGYRVLPMSLEKKEGLDVAMEVLKDKVTLMSGH
ncbi:MAG: GTPase RsgA, partial [Flavitalea sp.]